MLIVWVPYSRSAIGRAAYAVGSSESAAYMSGVPVDAAKFCAYVLSGLAASLAGLFLTFVTYSGEASAANGSRSPSRCASANVNTPARVRRRLLRCAPQPSCCARSD